MNRDAPVTPFQVCRIDHVVIRAVDADALVRFYKDVLGCHIEHTLDFGLTQLRAGESLIDIIATDSNDTETGAGFRNMDHFCLRVEPFDAERIRQHLTQHGIEASEVRVVYGAEGFGPSIYLDDPDGNTIELKGPAGKP